MGKAKIKIVSGSEASQFKEEMWEIYKDFYTCSQAFFYSRFQNDKHYALYLNKDHLVGFTGLFMGESIFDGQKVTTFGMGFTVILPAFRRQGLLQKTSLKLFFRSLLRNPFQPTYFWCHASTYKSYLILASFRTHYPSQHKVTPINYKEFMDQMGEQHFGNQYDKKTGNAFFEGIVIRDDSAIITEKHLKNSAINFYKKIKPKNPSDNSGVNGILVVAPINRSNIMGWLKDFYILTGSRFLKRALRVAAWY